MRKATRNRIVPIEADGGTELNQAFCLLPWFLNNHEIVWPKCPKAWLAVDRPFSVSPITHAFPVVLTSELGYAFARADGGDKLKLKDA